MHKSYFVGLLRCEENLAIKCTYCVVNVKVKSKIARILGDAIYLLCLYTTGLQYVVEL